MTAPSRSQPGATGTVHSVQVGKIGELPYRGGGIRTAFVESRVEGRVAVGRLGIVGDEQGDRVYHGGFEKAICAYPLEHFSYWERRLGKRFGTAAFAENLTLSGMVEDDVCIGDVFEVGTTTLQVSQPRNPCYKIAARHGIKSLTLWVQESGYTGYYLRVLEPGELAAADAVRLVLRVHQQLSVAKATRVMHRDKDDRAAIERMLVPELSSSWRETLGRRLNGATVDSVERLTGRAARSAGAHGLSAGDAEGSRSRRWGARV